MIPIPRHINALLASLLLATGIACVGWSERQLQQATQQHASARNFLITNTLTQYERTKEQVLCMPYHIPWETEAERLNRYKWEAGLFPVMPQRPDTLSADSLFRLQRTLALHRMASLDSALVFCCLDGLFGTTCGNQNASWNLAIVVRTECHPFRSGMFPVWKPQVHAKGLQTSRLLPSVIYYRKNPGKQTKECAMWWESGGWKMPFHLL